MVRRKQPNPNDAAPRETAVQRAAREKEEERFIYNRLTEEFGGGAFTQEEEVLMDAELHRLQAKQRANRRKP